MQATASGSGIHGPRSRARAERRNLRDFLRDELTDYDTDREEPTMLTNEDRADYGRAGLLAADPDAGENDTRTSAGDAIANILHCAVRERAEEVAKTWRGDTFDREAWGQSEDCRAFVEGVIDSAVGHLYAELNGEA